MDEVNEQIKAQLTRVRQEMAALMELLDKVQPSPAAKKTTARK